MTSRKRWTWTAVMALFAATALTPATTLTGPAGGMADAIVAQARNGEALAASLGCGACHEGLPDASGIRAAAPAFGPGSPPVPAEFVYAYLADPQPRRPEIAPARMPDFRLNEEERLALALYIGGNGGEALQAERIRHPDATEGEGRLLFGALGCSGCHAHPDFAAEWAVRGARVGPSLASAGARYRGEWIDGYLRAPVTVRPAGHVPGTGSRMPDFRLQRDEAADLTAYLGTLGTSGREATAPASPALTPWGRARAEGYLKDRLACLGCHTWRGEGGRIAPPLDGVSARLTAGAVAAMVHDPAGTRPGTGMPPSPFRPAILDRVVALLLEETAGWRPGLPPEIDRTERLAFLEAAAGDGGSRGKALYAGRCAQCHGTLGDGRGFNAAFLPVTPTVHADGEAMSLRPDDTLHDGIAGGGWVLDRSHRMPAFGRALAPAEIRSLVAYIRELCGCRPPGWSVGGAP